MSGNRVELSMPITNITEVKSTSAFFSLAAHSKYFINKDFYFSVGPEVSYLMWNYGSTYIDDERQTYLKETEFFNRTNFLVSSSVGFSKKVEESRKNAPIQIDLLWYLELRMKKGVTNILKEDFFGDLTSSILSFELVTGISFSSKK